MDIIVTGTIILTTGFIIILVRALTLIIGDSEKSFASTHSNWQNEEPKSIRQVEYEFSLKNPTRESGKVNIPQPEYKHVIQPAARLNEGLRSI